MEEEHSRKRKKSDKHSEKLKVPKVVEETVAPPLPPLPSGDSNPPLPHSDYLPLILSNQTEEPDGDIDMSTMLADHDMPADGDVVLPTVPSLSDLMSQSDICGSIASTDSSPGAKNDELAMVGESVFQTGSVLNEPDSPGKKDPTAEQGGCVKSSKDDNGTSMEPEASPTDAAGDNDMVQHAHALLDSTLAVKTEPSERNDGLNEEGYKTRTINLVRDIVPSYQNEVLPEGWKELTHSTGMPVYCHIASRVVTWSRPYFLDTRYAKNHDVPVCAIPCMIYRKMREEQEKKREASQTNIASNTEQTSVPSISAENSTQSNLIPSNAEQSSNEHTQTTSQQSDVEKAVTQEHDKNAPSTSSINSATVKTEAVEVKADASNNEHERFAPLSSEEFTDYCKSIFYFDTKEVKQFTSWKLRKEHERKVKAEQKQLKLSQDTTPRTIIPVTELPEEFQRDDRGKLKRDFIVINGTHTIVDIFHQYATWRSRKPPFVKTTAKDEGFECMIATTAQGELMGTGEGLTRKQAKENAAMCAMRVLIPKYAEKLIENALHFGDREKTQAGMDEYYKVFDTMSIKDQRVVEVAKATNQLYPFIVLKTCLARNFAMTESDITIDNHMEKQSNRVSLVCDMSVGKYSVKGARGKNIKTAQHVAAQDILQQLHPHLNTWGAILRLYGKFSDGSSEDIRHKSILQNTDEETLDASKSPLQVLENGNSSHVNVDYMKNGIAEVSEKNAIALVGEMKQGAVPVEVESASDSLGETGVTRASDSVTELKNGIAAVAVKRTTGSVGDMEKGTVRVAAEGATGSIEDSKQVSNMKKAISAYETADNSDGCSEKQAEVLGSGVQQDKNNADDSMSGGSTPTECTDNSSQTDIGGMNAFFSKKNLKPFVVLEEGVTAYECYSSHSGSYVLLAETGMQTVCVGHSTFHKATQMPEMSYNPYTNKNVIKPATDTAGSQGQSTVSKVEQASKGRLHKATQHPDKEYADPGHPPPPIVLPDTQLYAQQQALLQQQLAIQQQQQMALQQQYFYMDPNTGLPLSMLQSHQLLNDPQHLAAQQQMAPQQPWVYPQQYPTNEQQ